MKCLIREGLFESGQSYFDFGCGYGDDCEYVSSLGLRASGWDPAHRPDESRVVADVVNLGFVLNVIEEPEERAAALREAWGLSRRVLSVAARILVGNQDGDETPYGDGILTRIGTFQKYFGQSELREYVESTLGEPALPVAPGVFLVFRDESLRESFLARRYRRRGTTPRKRVCELRFERHREILEPLADWIAERGRPPQPDEFDGAPSLIEQFGSLKRAFALIRRVTGEEEWQEVEKEKSDDLLVYLALTSFRRRPRFSVLPVDLQRDIRAFFGTYKQACRRADELLFAVGDEEVVDAACVKSPIGRMTPNALWLHRDAVDHLPPILRVYEGCARAYLGDVDDANIVKLHRFSGKVSYLACPEFERIPHPPVANCLKLSLRSRRIDWYDDAAREDPRLLDEKDSFLPPDDPRRVTFARLTEQEREWGLLGDFRRRSEWDGLLGTYGLRHRGHRLTAG